MSGIDALLLSGDGEEPSGFNVETSKQLVSIGDARQYGQCNQRSIEEYMIYHSPPAMPASKSSVRANRLLSNARAGLLDRDRPSAQPEQSVIPRQVRVRQCA
jgi:hypothetical protein